MSNWIEEEDNCWVKYPRGPGAYHQPELKRLYSRLVIRTGTKGPPFSPGFWLEPGLKATFSPGSSQEPGLNVFLVFLIIYAYNN